MVKNHLVKGFSNILAGQGMSPSFINPAPDELTDRYYREMMNNRATTILENFQKMREWEKRKRELLNRPDVIDAIQRNPYWK